MKKYLKKICKFLYKHTIKSGQTFVSSLSCLLFSSPGAALSLMRCRKNRQWQKEECFILGNGPALNDALKNLKDKGKTDFFAVNFFALQDVFFELKPDNYMIMDPVFWQSGGSVTCDNEKRNEALMEDVVKFWNITKKVDWHMNLFIPERCPKYVLENISSSVNVVRINTTPIAGWNFFRFGLFNAALGMPLPQNVTNAAIYCAIFLRYKRIYLYGVNHSWMVDLRVDEKNRIYTDYKHFHADCPEKYFLKKGVLELHLRAYANTFASHTVLDEYSRACGVRVYNRTRGSFIDAYESDLD